MGVAVGVGVGAGVGVGDGWLSYSSVLAGQPDELTNKVVRVIRRDLWREAEVLDASDADVVELGQRPVSVAN